MWLEREGERTEKFRLMRGQPSGQAWRSLSVVWIITYSQWGTTERFKLGSWFAF